MLGPASVLASDGVAIIKPAGTITRTMIAKHARSAPNDIFKLAVFEFSTRVNYISRVSVGRRATVYATLRRKFRFDQKSPIVFGQHEAANVWK